MLSLRNKWKDTFQPYLFALLFENVFAVFEQEYKRVSLMSWKTKSKYAKNERECWYKNAILF